MHSAFATFMLEILGINHSYIQLLTYLIKVIDPKYSKHLPYTVAHTIDCVCSKMLNHGINPSRIMGYLFHFSSFLDENTF